MKKYILSLFVALIAGVSSQAWGQLKQPPPVNPSISNIWTALPNMDTARHSAASFAIGSKIYVVMGDTTSWYFRGRVVAATWELDTVTKTWTRKAPFPGKLRIGAIGFSIGNKGYVGGGRNYNKPDSLNNSISLNKDTFKIVQTGPTVWARFDTTLTYTNAKGDSLLKDFWEYDPGANTWTKKADIPGTVLGRAYGVGFALNGKGYVGLGYDNPKIKGSVGAVTSTVIGPYIDSIVFRPSKGKFDTVFQAVVQLSIDSVFTDSIIFMKDLWEYNPGTNTWVQKADYPGKKRAYASAFSLYTKAGVGLGIGDSVPNALYDDFYAYTPITDSWERMLDYPASKRYGAGAFGIGFLGYIVGGNDGLERKDFYEYNDISKTWDRLPNSPDSARSLAISGITGRMGYFGLGAGTKNSYKNTFKWIVDTNRISITSFPAGPFCGGQKVKLNYTTPTGITYNSGNKFIVQISDTAGSFFYPTDCSDTVSVDATGSFTFTIPAGTYESKKFRFRVVSTNPKLTGTPTLFNTEVKQLPSIVTEPINTTTCLQADAKIKVDAAGTNLTYQWRKNGTPISNGAKFAGVDSPTLNILAVDLSDGGNYDVVVSGYCSPAATSIPATLTVQNIPPPTVTLQPKSDTICEGDLKTFTINVTGTALNYRWIKGKDTLRNSPFIIGSATSSLTISPTRLRDSGWYKCLVFENCGSRKFSDSFKLSFYDNTDIIAQPANQDTVEQVDIGFKIKAKGHNLNYQWYKGTTKLTNGSKYIGVNTDTMTIKNLILQDVGFYQCKVWGDCGDTVWSLLGLLEIDPFPTITQQPDSASQCENSTVFFSVKVDGADFFYQWRKNGTPLSNGGNISGVNERTLVLSNITLSDNGLYDCEVSTGPYSKVISNQGKLTVNKIPSKPVVSGFGTTQLTCDVGGGKEYRWYIDNIYAAQFTTQTIAVTQVGDYRVRVTSDKNCVSPLSDPYFWFPTSGIADINAGTIKLYPNPATSSVEVEIPAGINNGTVKVIDLLGKTIMETKFDATDSYMLNISTLPQGMYIVTVSSQNDTYIGRLVKQ
jgi:N-acetylneuraminic acid mutarotase